MESWKIILSLANVVFCLAAATTGSATVNPGTEIKATASGINFMKDAIVRLAQKEANRYSIPDISFRSGIRATLRNIRIEKLSLGNPRITNMPPNQLRLHANDVSLQIRGSFAASLRVLWFSINVNGKFSASASNINTKLEVKLGKDKRGRPLITVRPQTCSSTIGRFTFSVTNTGYDVVANLGLGFFRANLKSMVTKQICPRLTKIANDQSRKFTTRYNPYHALPRFGFGADLALMRPPTVSTDSVSVDVAGTVYRIGHRHTRYPFTPGPLPRDTGNDKMLHVLIGEYTANSLLYSLWKNGTFSGAVSESSFLRKFPVNLTTQALSSFVPGLRNYPGRPLNMSYNMPSYPTTRFSDRKIYFSGVAQFKVDIDMPQGVKLHAFTIDVAIDTIGNVSIHNHAIIGSMSRLLVNVSLNNTNVGVVPVSFFNLMTQALIPKTILPAINRIGEKGFAITRFWGFRTRNEYVKLKQGAMELSTDVSY